MSFVGRTLAATTIMPFTPGNYDEVFPPNAVGSLSVTGDAALAIPAVYACTTVISEDIAKVPLQMFQYVGTDGKAVARNHPLYERLHDQPNDYQTAIEFREMMTAFALNRGKGIAEKVVQPGNKPEKLRPLHPDLVSTEVTTDGVLRYRYQDPIARRERVLLADEVFVVRGRFGRSVLDFARSNFELQLQMQAFASEMYRKGPRFAGALQHPKLLNDTARKNLRKALDEYSSGGERVGRPLLLEEGMTWTSVGISMADAEFLATLQHGVADVCRYYRVPQHKIQELMRSTNNNISQQSVDYVTDSLVAWAVRWEQAIRRDLIVAPQTYFAQHNLEGLLRGDFKTRMEGYAIAVALGWMTRNEVRQKENMTPLPGMDEALTPLNMSTGVPGTSVAVEFANPINAGTQQYLRVLVRDGAARVVRKEIATLAKLAEKTGGEGDEWRSGVRAFYREHAEFVGRVLRLPDEQAEAYAEGRCARVLEAGPAVLDDPETVTIADLTETALDKSEVLQIPATTAA